MCKIKQVNFNNISKIVQMMDKKLKEEDVATKEMLDAFSQEIPQAIYFVAQKDIDGKGDLKFGLMALSPPPKIQDIKLNENLLEQDETELTEETKKAKALAKQLSGIDQLIDNSIWVEALVADQDSGLGGKLLQHAALYAAEHGKTGVSLAAYEFDKAPDQQNKYKIIDPYSVASYYENKDFTYTASGYIEEDNGKSLYYPIYFLPVQKPML